MGLDGEWVRTSSERRRGMGKAVAFGQVERNVVVGEDGAELGLNV